MPKFPHAVIRDGRILRIKWGDSEDPDWDPSELLGQIRYSDAQIILNPAMRSNKRLALGVLLHELTHDIDHKLAKMTPEARKKKYHNSASMNRWSMPHVAFNRFAYPFADFLIENEVTIPCACEACGKKKGEPGGSPTG